MICSNCGKNFSTKKIAHVLWNGRPEPVSFCSYKCYIEFWHGVDSFEPLPEYIKPQTREENK